MNEAAWQPAAADGRAIENSSSGRLPLIIAGVSLALGIGFSGWYYFNATERFPDPRFMNALLGVLIPTLAGGSLSLGAFGIGAWMLRSGYRKRLESDSENYRRLVTSLRLELADCDALRGTVQNVEKEKAALVYTNTQLQSELDQRKKAEKSLLWTRQELESSKTVLQLHVQERSEELQRLQEQYELILNSAGEGICGLNLDGKATFINPAAARMIGWKVEESLGKTEKEIFDEQAMPPSHGSKNIGERIFCRKDGNLLPVECVKTPLNENGRVVGSVLIFKDITERKRVEEAIARKAEELARSNAELEQFAFVASHDLQEPLRKIQAFGDRLKTKVEGAIGADARDYLERMQNAAARMRNLINDLLTFSRVIRRTEAFVPVDLNQVLKALLSDLEVRIEKSGARIEVGKLPTIEADPMQMHQLLLNLLSNALKFQTPGSEPVIKVDSRLFTTLSGRQFCELTVCDNGIGFEEKYLEKIFVVFQRLHGRTEYEGTGVGLAVCRRITDRHHGNITAKSQLGQGATFIITLPLKQETHDTGIAARLGLGKNPAVAQPAPPLVSTENELPKALAGATS